MAFELPMATGHVAMIDVRRGGEATAEDMVALMTDTTPEECLGWAVYAGIPDDKVLTYAQFPLRQMLAAWLADQEAALGEPGKVDRWGALGYRLISSANRGPLDLAGANAVLAHTGLFALRDRTRIGALIGLAGKAARQAIETTPALYTANFHASLDDTRLVNIGFWSDVEAFKAFLKKPPFDAQYWADYADNEPGFFERVAHGQGKPQAEPKGTAEGGAADTLPADTLPADTSPKDGEPEEAGAQGPAGG